MEIAKKDYIRKILDAYRRTHGTTGAVRRSGFFSQNSCWVREHGCPSSVRELFRKGSNSGQVTEADCDTFLGVNRAELVGVAGGIRLENHCTVNRTGGSNPSSSVNKIKDLAVLIAIQEGESGHLSNIHLTTRKTPVQIAHPMNDTVATSEQLILMLLRSLLTGLRGRVVLQAEIIALRHQLTVLQRTQNQSA